MSEGQVSLLQPDIDYVLNGPPSIPNDSWICEIWADNQRVEVLKVGKIEQQEYFENHYAQLLSIEVFMGEGQYKFKLLPGKSDIIVHLVKVDPSNLGYYGGEMHGIVEEGFYTGTLPHNEEDVVEGDLGMYNDIFSADLKNQRTVTLQLQDKIEEQVRLIQVGGTFRKTTIKQLINSLMTSVLNDINVESSTKTIIGQSSVGVQLIEPDNDREYEQIIIPDGLYLTDLPGWLQKNHGVYNTGLSHYLRKGVWHIFPAYDYENNAGRKTLQVSLLPTNSLLINQKNFRKTGSSIHILSHTNKKIVEINEAGFANQGNGVKYLDASVLLAAPNEGDPDKAESVKGDGSSSFGGFGGSVNTVVFESFTKGPAKDISRVTDAVSGYINPDLVPTKDNKKPLLASERVSEFVMEERPNGVNNIPLLGDGISSNPHLAQSTLASQNGSYLICQWNYSDPSLAEPGMISTIRYERQGLIEEFKGVLVGAIHNTVLKGQGFTSEDYINSTILAFFVNKKLKTN